MEAITPATLGDVPQLALLLNLLFTQEADFTPDMEKQKRGLRLIIKSAHVGVILAAHDGDEVVGMVSLLFTISTAEGGPVCWLEDMVVRPDRQRREGFFVGNTRALVFVCHWRASSLASALQTSGAV